MIEQIGNIWEARTDKDFVVVTTNGMVQRNGSNVMGKGIAKEAATRYRWLPKALGECITRNGVQVEVFQACRLIAFPTKFHFWEDSNLSLIETSTAQLVSKVEELQLLEDSRIRILLPRPGCGCGNRGWAEVAPILARYLHSDSYIIFHKEGEE